MRGMLRFLGLFALGWFVFAVEAVVVLKLDPAPLDPNIWMGVAVVFFLYVLAFVLITFVVPGILVPEPPRRRWLRIAGGTLLFAVAVAAPVAIFGRSIDSTVLSAFLLSLIPGATTIGASLYGVTPRNA